MNEDSNKRMLAEQAWRYELTEPELRQASQIQSPEGQGDLALESVLTGALRRLPDRPVSSNFTDRVLQAVQLEKAAAERRSRRPAVLRWLPRFATGFAVLVISFLGYQQVQTRRAIEMGRSLAIISAPALPPEILKDFDAIQVMSRTPAADEQLLAIMQ